MAQPWERILQEMRKMDLEKTGTIMRPVFVDAMQALDPSLTCDYLERVPVLAGEPEQGPFNYEAVLRWLFEDEELEEPPVLRCRSNSFSDIPHTKADVSFERRRSRRALERAMTACGLRRMVSAMAGDREARPRILVTGATGLLGRQVYAAFDTGSWELMGLRMGRGGPPLVYCDLTRSGALPELVEQFRPHVILHLAAARFPDEVAKNPVKARALNVEATRSIAEASHKVKAWLLFVSTDYVFDGTSPPYEVDDKPNPLNSYGVMKAEGEDAILQSDPNAAVLRVPLLYGPCEYLEESAVTQLWADLLINPAMKVDNEQLRYPLLTCEAAAVIKRMVELHAGGTKMNGIFHWQGAQALTKHSMVNIIAEVRNTDATSIEVADCKSSAPRPMNSSLSCSRLEALFGPEESKLIRKSFRESISHILDAYYAANAAGE